MLYVQMFFLIALGLYVLGGGIGGLMYAFDFIVQSRETQHRRKMETLDKTIELARVTCGSLPDGKQLGEQEELSLG